MLENKPREPSGEYDFLLARVVSIGKFREGWVRGTRDQATELL